MYKQRGNAAVFFCCFCVGFIGYCFVQYSNHAVEQRYIENCIRNGGKIEVQTKYVDTNVREEHKVTVCIK